jgi:hypothetical protein
MDSFSNEDSKGFVVVLVLTFVICCSMVIGKYYHTKNNNIIEQNIELQKHNDSLRIKVDNLDSIKNAKVIEVKALDNDSTIKLFYQLIK